MFDILDLISEFPQLLVFRSDQLFSTTGTILLPVDFLAEMFLQFVLVLPLRSQVPTIKDVSVGPIVRNSHMDLAQIDTGDFTPDWCADSLFHTIGSNGCVLGPCPVDDNRFWQFPPPIQDKRIIPSSIREDEFTVLQTNSRVFVLNTEVPLSPSWRLGTWIGLAAFSPRLERSKKGLYTGIRSMGMQLVGREQAHQMLRLEPNALVSDSTPEEDQCLGVEFPTSMSKLIKLSCLADVDSSHLVH